MATSNRPSLAAGLPARKPMARATRVSLYEREIRISLAAPAIELLFQRAHVLSEGQWQGDRWFGSTMITLDLEGIAANVRDDCDAAAARRVAELVTRDARVTARARSLAGDAAAERAGRPLCRVGIDVAARAAGTCVHIDVDVEGAASD